MSKDRIRVLLADDHALVCDTLVLWMRGVEDVEIIGVARSPEEAVRLAGECEPDVLLVDVEMGGSSAFDAAKKIQKLRPNCKVMFLSGYFHDHYIQKAVDMKASGYLTKLESAERVLDAIRRTVAGELVFSPEVGSRLTIDGGGVRLRSHLESGVAELSEREIEVLRHLARGLAKKEIAKVLKLSTLTVNRHTANIMNKLDIHDRVELARFAIREGISEA
jgi:DNA-binding NarL/FixJ family response regulator